MDSQKLWIYKNVSEKQAEELSLETGCSSLLSRILINRGFDCPESVKKFINPEISELHNPFLMKDMDIAVDRIVEAIKKHEKILVYGDYDVDGITSTAILSDFLAKQNALVDYYIPDRFEEGYGLSKAAIDKLSYKSINLIITVDCGITAVDEVRYIMEKGMDVIITDHHKCKESLPKACAVVNPNRADCNYPFKSLAGVGVAYKLITALCIKLSLKDVQNHYLDMVSVGTIADVVSLSDENRIIVKYGLEKLANTSNKGLMALMSCSGIKDERISSYTVSFVLAPRINAAGRMGDASRAVTLFLTDDYKEAEEISAELHMENKLRQETELDILNQTIKTIEENPDYKNQKVLVVAGNNWHHGIIGIAASRITEKYYRPCILLSIDDEGICKGSGRSIEGFNLFCALDYCKDLLINFGGHELAAGLSLEEQNIDGLRDKINEYAKNNMEEAVLVPKIKIDAQLKIDDISMEKIKELDLLAPFGASNPVPVFTYHNMKVKDMSTVGDNRHLRLKLSDKGLIVNGIGFNMGNKALGLNRNEAIDIVCSLEINNWNSIQKVQINLKDLRSNNREALLKKYYLSLRNCIRDVTKDHSINASQAGEEDSLAKGFQRITEREFERIIRGVCIDEKIAILINDINCIDKLLGVLQITQMSIKKRYKICYTKSNSNDTEGIQIIINPSHSLIDLNEFEKVFIYGNWVDKKYLREIIELIDSSKLYLHDVGFLDCDVIDIIPERDDLAAVYRFLKNSGSQTVIIDDIFYVVSKVSSLYNIKMNEFKLLKCIDIFEELNLLKKQEFSSGIKIMMPDIKSKLRTNLENSAIYRSLHALRVKG